jgi:hypothetical protein
MYQQLQLIKLFKLPKLMEDINNLKTNLRAQTKTNAELLYLLKLLKYLKRNSTDQDNNARWLNFSRRF